MHSHNLVDMFLIMARVLTVITGCVLVSAVRPTAMLGIAFMIMVSIIITVVGMFQIRVSILNIAVGVLITLCLIPASMLTIMVGVRINAHCDHYVGLPYEHGEHDHKQVGTFLIMVIMLILTVASSHTFRGFVSAVSMGMCCDRYRYAGDREHDDGEHHRGGRVPDYGEHALDYGGCAHQFGGGDHNFG